MATRTNGFLLLTLSLIILTFSVKKKCFIQPDGISLTLNVKDLGNEHETYGISSLFCYKRLYVKPKNRCICMLLLLLCGDIETQPGPLCTSKDLKKICKNKGLKIFHQNIRGLHGKFDEVSDLLTNNRIDVLCLTELFLNKIISSTVFNIPGFTFLRKDRHRGSGGGVGIYIRQEINFTRRQDLEDPEMESIFIEISAKNSKPFIIGCIYRPPDSSKHLPKNFGTILSTKLQKIDDEKKETIIVGDLNIDYLNNDHQTMKDTFKINGFTQLLSTATRVTETSATLIDIIQTNKALNISHNTVIQAGLSDHDLIGCVRKMNNVKYQPEIIRCRNYSHYNTETINNELRNKDWNPVFNTNSPTNAWSYMKELLKETIDKHAPFITKRIKGRKSPWISNNLSKEMNVRDQLLRKARKSKSQFDWNEYKRKRNFVTNEIQRAKRNYYKTKLTENSNKPQQFWKVVNDIYSTKSNKEKLTKQFRINNELVNDAETIANGFCEFFSTIANNLKSKSFPLKDLIFKPRSNEVMFEKCQFNFRNVTEKEVLKHLKNLKRSCAVGLDEIPGSFLRDIAYVIAKPLTHIINCSLKNASVPSDFKSSKVVPIFKTGQKDNFDNYRPISVLPAVSKIIEKCVHTQIMEHLEHNNLLSIHQFGFRKKRSTELAAVCFLDEIRKAMDTGMLTGAIYIDLSKAFDTISHASLIDKLPSYGITGLSQEWFCNYLFGRYQQVSYHHSLSDKVPIFCGVPQGSILGPLLFLLHFNDAANILSSCKIVKFADDTVLFYSHKNIEEIERVLNKDFATVCGWLENNELVINTKKGKTEVMVFGTSKKLKNTPPIQIEHNYVKITNTDSYKYLGVSLNCSLNMTEHIRKTIKKVSSRITLLKSMRHLLDSKSALKIYKAMILPIMTYCPFVTFGTIPQNLSTRIEQIESRACRIIGGNTQVPSSISVQKKRIATYVRKCIENDVCENFENYFEIHQTNFNTRNNNAMVKIPKVKLESARKSFSFQGAVIYNGLPKEIRTERDFTKFKSMLKSIDIT